MTTDNERLYEIELQTAEGWLPYGSLTVKDWAIRQTFLDRATEEDLPDGKYRLLTWDENFASGSYYSVSLTSERVRTSEMANPIGVPAVTS